MSMQRLRFAAIVLLAVLLAAQLTLHHHSLIPEGGGAPPSPCAVCAFGADPRAVAAPLLTFVAVVLFLLTPREHAAFASCARARIPSRGPPPAF
ncbi:MAG TPA: hypothetical protein VNI54_16725 [Thermoanaerobaculia bacterium]|nr:hypothetical protein [Thermoanaerobaculia bacterium]